MATGPSKLSAALPAAGRFYALRVAVVGGADVRQVVRAELLQEGLGEDYGDHGLPDHGRSRHGAGIRPLLEGPRGLPGREVDGAQCSGDGRDRLHRGRYDDGLAVCHPALDPAEAVAGTRGVVFAGEDLILHLAGAMSCQVEAHPELDALYGVYGHHGGGEPRVELVAPVDVRAQPRRAPLGYHGELPTQGVG